MGTLRRTCAAVPRRGPLPKSLWTNLLLLLRISSTDYKGFKTKRQRVVLLGKEPPSRVQRVITYTTATAVKSIINASEQLWFASSRTCSCNELLYTRSTHYLATLRSHVAYTYKTKTHNIVELTFIPHLSSYTGILTGKTNDRRSFDDRDLTLVIGKL